MNPTDFDRLVARASDPRLIPGIYNYCDGRCQRCPFTDRCLSFLDDEDAEPRTDGTSRADSVPSSLERGLEFIAEAARRQGVDPASVGAEPASHASDEAYERHRDDPLVVSARRYGDLAWRLARALAPVVAARGDASVIEAIEIIDWFSSMIGAKVFRAISGKADRREPEDAVQTDFNGSAKVALLGIAESRVAWTVLMEKGKATADGVPAHAVRILDALDRAVRERFPHAMAFVRPGFDESGVRNGRRQS
ncbi:MAG: hypothetical protein HY047_19270 [Acidobacteria bacterium]|nr:hypothetical protein [Acidobacteriota bacterium]